MIIIALLAANPLFTTFAEQSANMVPIELMLTWTKQKLYTLEPSGVHSLSLILCSTGIP